MGRWIWQQSDWPHFLWQEATLAEALALALARLAQGKLPGMATLLDESLAKDAAAAILVDDSLTTSAIEGQR